MRSAGSCGRSSGKKSILRAFANLAAVRKEKLTSWRSTLVMYGRETCIRAASSDCDTPSSFMRRSIRRRNADPILSTALISFQMQLLSIIKVGVMSWSSSAECFFGFLLTPHPLPRNCKPFLIVVLVVGIAVF